tara:strand:- start:1694 stop:1861 length:168 start_codon:yes stop_codon:yes gene_type:complete
MSQEKTFTYTFTQAQDDVLVQMIRYFNELGVGGDMNEDDFDSLVDVVCNHPNSVA